MLHTKAKALTYAALALFQLEMFSVAATSGKPATVTGTVTYLQRIALPADAVIEVRLLDVSRAHAPAPTIAQQIIKAQGKQVPFAFTLKYDSVKIKESSRYEVRARILVKGKLRYTNAQAYPVITLGNPSRVDIVVEPASHGVMPSQTAGLENTHWTLVELNGKPVEAGSTAKEAYFELNSNDKRLQGSSGCNRMTGGYETKGDELQVSKVVMTRMACVKGMEIEAEFSKALAATTKFKLNGRELELSGAEGLLARFKAGAK
jgi:putative lipoprotein